jgi:hypothetical protein
MHHVKAKFTFPQVFNFASTLLVIAVIVTGEAVLIGENAAFLRSQGKPQLTAVALSACVALLIPIVPSVLVLDRRSWVQMGKWLFVAALIAMQVYFASQTVLAPQLKEMTSNMELTLIEDYKSQLKQYDKQIQVYQQHIDSYPDGFRTKRAELSNFQLQLIEDRRKVLADIAAITQKAGNQPENLAGMFQHLTILATILYRLALEIGVVILACSLRNQFKTVQPTLVDQPVSEIPVEPIRQPEPKAAEETIASPREFVLSIHPKAFCKSKNGRKGPYAVYASPQADVEIAMANGNAVAWQKAALQLRSLL